MPTAAVNGIEIAYERSGEGPRLLFLGGSGSSLAESAVLRAPFAEGFDLAAHDQRGLGATSVPPGPYSMADYAADALGLMDHLGWASCRLVGISFGGMVAQEVAVTAPERIERLALLCTSSGGAGGASYPLHELAALTDDERAAAYPQLIDTRFTPGWLDTHEADRRLLSMMAGRGGRERTAEARRGEREQLEARRHLDVWDRLPRITCPTLVASGRHDGIAPPANGEAIAGQVPGAELRLYEGGHAFVAQDPTALPEVVAFLAADPS